MKIPPPATRGGTSCRNRYDPAGCSLRSARGLLLVGPASVARARLVDPLYRRLSCFSSSYVIRIHLPCLRGAFARAADLSFLRSAFALLIFLLLRRLAAPPVFSFLCPPREGWAERREAHQL